MKRSPLKRKSATKRRTLSPRCVRQRCNRIARIENLCVPHAEKLADGLFSRWVRARDERCTAAGMFGLACGGTMVAAHVVGRRNHAVRYDPGNVFQLCSAHHACVDQFGAEAAKYRWAVTALGGDPDIYDAQMLLAQQPASRVASIEAALAWLSPVEESA